MQFVRKVLAMSSTTIGILAEAGSNVFDWRRSRTVLEDGTVWLVKFVERPENSQARRVVDLPARAAWRLLNQIEGRGLEPSFERFDDGEGISLSCRFSGHFKDFAPPAIDAIHASEVDLILRLGGRGIYRGAILDVATHGLVSIHHGDNRAYRGGPPGFWEVVNGEKKCGFIVQRLTPSLDGGEVLARGAVPNAGSVVANRRALFAAADAALADVLARFLKRGRLSEPELSVRELGPIYRMPTLRDLGRYHLAKGRGEGAPYL